MQKYRIASIMLILITLAVCAVPSVFSAEKGTVRTEEIVKLEKDDAISIPVVVENSEALMGFKLSFTPSGDEVQVTAVKSGELTENGFFNHNADIKDGTFDVVWSGTEAVDNDGVVCYLQAECKEDFDEFIFEISYSQPDTFDEEFNDVELNCENIVLKGNKSAESVDETEDVENSDYSDIAQNIIENKGKDNTLAAIESVLEKYNCDSPDDVSEDYIVDFLEDISVLVKTFDSATVDFDNDEKLEIINEIYRSLEEDKATDETDKPATIDTPESDNGGNYVITISIIGISVIVLIVVGLLLRRRKKA